MVYDITCFLFCYKLVLECLNERRKVSHAPNESPNAASADRFMSDSTTTTTTISLPPHLVSTLEAVLDILPEELRIALSIPLKEQVEISYSTLLNISQWSRTAEARKEISKKQLDANDYTMISLLAGTITSPLSKLPQYIPPPDPSETAKKDLSDRRAIIALVNSLFSIAGAGYAGWWASQHAGWRDEWVRGVFVDII